MIELAKALQAEVDRASELFRDLDEPGVSRARGPGKWAKKEILGHLIDSAANNHQRFVRARFASPLLWPGYDQEAWVSVHHYRERPWLELIDVWVALNRQVAAVVASVPAERLETPCVIGNRESASLEWYMRDYLRHLEHHVEQIERA